MAQDNDQITSSAASTGVADGAYIAQKKALRLSAIPTTNHDQPNPYTPSNPDAPVISTTTSPTPPTVPVAPEVNRIPMRAPTTTTPAAVVVPIPAPPVVPVTIPVAAPVAKSATSPVAPPHLRHKVKPMSDTTVLPPDFKGVFVSDDDRHGRRGYDNYNIYDGTERIKDSMTAGFAGVNSGVGIVGVAVEKTGAAAQLATEKLGAAIGVAVEKTSASGQLTTEKTAAATLIANERTAAQNAASVALGFATNASAQQAGYAAIQLGQVKYAGEVAVQNTMNAAASALAASTNTASILRGQEVFAGQAALTAAVNQAATILAIKECCCESQKLVLAQANEVKALINATEAARTGRELFQAQAEILALKYRFPHPPFPPMPV